MSRKIIVGDDFVTRFVTVGEKLIDDVLADPAELKRTIIDLKLKETPRKSLARLRQPCKDVNQVPEQLKGLGGFVTSLFLEAFDSRFVQEEGYSGDVVISEIPDQKPTTKVSGKICDYIFIPDPEDPYKEVQTGSGHLSVEVFQEQFNSLQALRDCKPDKTAFYHWDIEVTKFEIHKRYDLAENPDHTNFPNNPFPTLACKEPEMEFPEFSLDKDDPRSIWCRGLNHKLFAKDQDIVVESVYQEICHHPADGGSGEEDVPFHLLDKNDPVIYETFYQSTPESCIDIMFKGYPPLAHLPTQSSYCLGRCARPAIVNSGN